MRGPGILLAVVFCSGVMFLGGCGSDFGPSQDAAQVDSAPKNWDDHTQGLVFTVGYEKGLEKAKSEDKPAMMFVTTTWCGYCTKLAEENFNDPEVRELLKNFVCVIVDGDVEKDAKQTLNSTKGYPHVIFLLQDGKKAGECLGYRPVKDFKTIVQSALDQVAAG